MVSFKTYLFYTQSQGFFLNTCVHYQWKETNACQHDRDTVITAHAWFA